jgi:transcriptional regulator with XRE-family HTH domain
MTIKSEMTKKTLNLLEEITGGPLSLGDLMKSIRLSDEISQVEFAKQLKISKQHLCDIERGRKYVSPKLASQYADKLGYSQKQFIRLALQDELNRSGLHFEVEIKKAA